MGSGAFFRLSARFERFVLGEGVLVPPPAGYTIVCRVNEAALFQNSWSHCNSYLVRITASYRDHWYNWVLFTPEASLKLLRFHPSEREAKQARLTLAEAILASPGITMGLR